VWSNCRSSAGDVAVAGIKSVAGDSGEGGVKACLLYHKRTSAFVVQEMLWGSLLEPALGVFQACQFVQPVTSVQFSERSECDEWRIRGFHAGGTE
jgi:hypothetical protein